MFPNLDKIVTGLVKNGIRSLQEDAKQYERRARDARQLADLLKKMAPEVIKALKPAKFKPLTKKQLKKIQRMNAGGGPIAVAAVR